MERIDFNSIWKCFICSKIFIYRNARCPRSCIHEQMSLDKWGIKIWDKNSKIV